MALLSPHDKVDVEADVEADVDVGSTHISPVVRSRSSVSLMDLSMSHSCHFCRDILADFCQECPEGSHPDTNHVLFYPGITAQQVDYGASNGCSFYQSLIHAEELSDTVEILPDSQMGINIVRDDEFGLSSLTFGYKLVREGSASARFLEIPSSEYLLCTLTGMLHGVCHA